MACKPYPSDVRDDEWALVAPSLSRITADPPHARSPAGGLLWAALDRPRGGGEADAAARLSPGIRCPSKASVGSQRVRLTPSSALCAPCCNSPRGTRQSPRLRSLIAVRGHRRLKAARGPGPVGSKRRWDLSKVYIAERSIPYTTSLDPPGAEVGNLVGRDAP
jgi:hypothetical protein